MASPRLMAVRVARSRGKTIPSRTKTRPRDCRSCHAAAWARATWSAGNMPASINIWAREKLRLREAGSACATGPLSMATPDATPCSEPFRLFE